MILQCLEVVCIVTGAIFWSVVFADVALKVAIAIRFAIDCNRKAKKRCEVGLGLVQYNWILIRMFIYDVRRALR